MDLLDTAVSSLLGPLALWILASGLDDLVLDVALLCSYIAGRLRRTSTGRSPGGASRPAAGRPGKRLAILVPLWREDAVIGRMLAHNISAIAYTNYCIFAGAYPNDEPTLQAVREAAARFPNVQLAVCPHGGPTSKADCLNSTYREMLRFEEEHGVRFDAVITHDAEDVIHPESLRLIDEHLDEYDMVQVPVLPLAMPLHRLTHGVYCDEFAEYQTKDVPVRKMLGGFLPSNGVGTAYSRSALEALAAGAGGRIFEPDCLTEDYETGLRLHDLGFRQVFVPIRFSGGRPVATREYFPLTRRAAVKQRTRWVMGIALQAWQRHGWGRSLPRMYWFWRDRKGLIGNPVSLLANGVFLYGLLTWILSRAAGRPWALREMDVAPWIGTALWATLLMQAERSLLRTACCARIYGVSFALGTPLRAIWGNWINSCATLCAIFRYVRARLRGEPLAWLKTQHSYPVRSRLLEHGRRLGEILAAAGSISPEDVDRALAAQPPGMRLGEYLVKLGKLAEADLCRALSLQSGLPLVRIDPACVPRRAARSLPAAVMRRWGILPFRIVEGSLFLAGPAPPEDEMHSDLRNFTSLGIRFHLVTPGNFEELKAALW